MNRALVLGSAGTKAAYMNHQSRRRVSWLMRWASRWDTCTAMTIAWPKSSLLSASFRQSTKINFYDQCMSGLQL